MGNLTKQVEMGYTQSTTDAIHTSSTDTSMQAMMQEAEEYRARIVEPASRSTDQSQAVLGSFSI